jgi:uncharacterized protein YerC
MKVRAKKLSEKERVRTLDALYTAVNAVRGREATKLFLRDLLTESERIMLGRRVIIAKQLLQGASYRDLNKSLGVGPDTVYRVQQWLHDQLPGYEQAIAGLEKEFDRRRERKLYAQSALYRLKKKYPLYFLLVPTPKGRKSKKNKN